MAAPILMPCLALRGQEGVWMIQGSPPFSQLEQFPRDPSGACKFVVFSKDGSLFAWKSPTGLKVVTCPGCREVMQVDRPRIADVVISPNNRVLATWEPFTLDKENPQGGPNMFLWDIKSGKLLQSIVQKKQLNWEPQWSVDESICSRNINNEIVFYENNDFETVSAKLHLQKVTMYRMPAQGGPPYHVAIYVPGMKGQPSYVRVYKYPNFGGPAAAVANKSFYKADSVNLFWNNKGTALLVLASTEVAADSYYGEQGLHFISVNGESCLVPRAKNGPVYNVVWSPNSIEFCVVYGFMPAKATLYNLKCEPVFDFGTGPRNLAYYNPQGNILCLAGFGNLQGNMEFWDVKGRKLISKPQATDTTYFEWCADGAHYITATTSPRLRVGNGVKVWHYSGTVLYNWKTTGGAELYQVQWQPVNEGVFPARPISYKTEASAAPKPNPESTPSRYVPPAMRNRPGAAQSSSHREAYEPPSNVKKQEVAQENLSKSALKNKKRREAKQKAKTEETPGPASQPVAGAPSGDNPEKDKKIRNLKKKLQQIEKLKAQQAEGKQLELNQVEKLKTEESLLKELRDLELG